MRKKTIAILFGIGFGLSLLAAFLLIGGIVSLSSAVASCSDYSSSSCSAPASTGGFVALLLLGSLVALGGEILTIISWVAILIKQAQRQQWAWFICTLLFGGICMLIWLIIEPEVPAAPRYAVAYPGYPPAEQPRYPDPYRLQ